MADKKTARALKAHERRASLDGKVCVVTEASRGVGRVLARELASLGASLVLIAKNEHRGRDAVDEILRDGAKRDRVELVVADIAHHDSVVRVAQRLLDEYRAIDRLIVGPGSYFPTRRQSPDGVELTWATNVLGPHLLSTLLLPRLQSSAPSRVLRLVGRMAGGLDVDDPQLDRRGYGGLLAYRQSQQAARMLAWALGAKLKDTGVMIGAAVTGDLVSPFAAQHHGILGSVLSAGAKLLAQTEDVDADTPLYLATASELEFAAPQLWFRREPIKCPFRDHPDERRLLALCTAWVDGPAGDGPEAKNPPKP